MKKLFFLALLFCQPILSQDYPLLTSEERAYLFHIVRKSPILENNIGRFFDYKGPEITHLNGEIHFDSIEQLIINQPELLIIRSEEIAKSPIGLIAEAANKMAIWELNKAILESRKKEDKQNETFLKKYAIFESYILPELPPNAFKSKNEGIELHPKLDNAFNPSLSLDDKKALLQSFRFLDQEDALMVLKAINTATNMYVEKRANEIFLSLGGKATIFKNILIAAGDGSNTSGLLEEREKDEKGRWNKGLPKAVGLFPYNLSILEKVEKKKTTKNIEPNRAPVIDLFTAGNNRMTNLHFDVWGYNAEKQTTVVIEKNGYVYRLFGSGETRFLSPDSSFSGKGTYQSLIDDLKNNKIRNLEEMIYGKKGFDYWIDYNEKKKNETELRIEKSEKSHSDLGYTPIKTSSKVSRTVKKQKKKSKVLTDYQPTTDSNKEIKKNSQNDIIYLYQKYEAYKAKIAELKKQKEEALELIATYQTRLDAMHIKFGLKPMPFKEENGLYLFKDSTIFDMNTQEFIFPATMDTIPFEVRLLAIPNNCLSEEADEVMLHINSTDASPNYNARVQIHLKDIFESDSYALQQPLLSSKDSVAMRLFFEGLLDKKVKFSIIARGNGVGARKGAQITKANPQIEEKNYPGDNSEEQMKSKMDSNYADLRLSEVYIQLGREIVLEVNSYTDPVVSNVKITDAAINSQMAKYNWSKNEILSGLRTNAILEQLKSEINVLAGNYFSRTDAKIIIDRFNKELQKTNVSISRNSLKK